MRKFVSMILCLAMLLSLSAGFMTASAAEVTNFEFWTFNGLHVEFYEKMAEIWNGSL